MTLHRPALVDGPLLGEVLEQLAVVARDIPVLFPAHPRTQARIGDRTFDGVTILEPLGYLEFLSLEADARAVLTDSGGVQEETTYLGVPCFTLRASTERPVTVGVGTNTLLGLSTEQHQQPDEAPGRGPVSARCRSGAVGRPGLGANRGRAAGVTSSVLLGSAGRVAQKSSVRTTTIATAAAT